MPMFGKLLNLPEINEATHLFDLVRSFSRSPGIKTIKLNYTTDGIYWRFMDLSDKKEYEAMIELAK